jgi:hypothetical protein
VTFGWQEAYLSNSGCSSIGYVHGVFPAPDSGGVDAPRDSMIGTDRGVSVGGADEGIDDEGSGTAGVDIGKERHRPH